MFISLCFLVPVAIFDFACLEMHPTGGLNMYFIYPYNVIFHDLPWKITQVWEYTEISNAN